jgi:hypothetical protein
MRSAVRPARLRPSASHGGGLSSLLRLSTAARLPSPAALDDWIGRVSRPMGLDGPAPAPAAERPLITRLWPTAGGALHG